MGVAPGVLVSGGVLTGIGIAGTDPPDPGRVGIGGVGVGGVGVGGVGVDGVGGVGVVVGGNGGAPRRRSKRLRNGITDGPGMKIRLRPKSRGPRS